jgi:hypothetical protein
LLLFFSDSVETQIIGGIAIGYALGKIGAGVMSYRTARVTWAFTEDLLDWNKVSEYENNENKNH